MRIAGTNKLVQPDGESARGPGGLRVAALFLWFLLPAAGQVPVDLEPANAGLSGEATVWTWGAGPGYSLDVLETCAGRDSGCAVVRNERAGSRELAYVTKTFDAAALRGKQVRFSAALRIDSFIGQGQIFVRVDRPAGVGFQRYSAGKPIPGDEWTVREIAGTIDEDAVGVTVGMRFVGLGEAYFADPRLEEAPE